MTLRHDRSRAVTTFHIFHVDHADSLVRKKERACTKQDRYTYMLVSGVQVVLAVMGMTCSRSGHIFFLFPPHYRLISQPLSALAGLCTQASLD